MSITIEAGIGVYHGAWTLFRSLAGTHCMVDGTKEVGT